MAISAFAKSRLESITNAGFIRAKKLADLAIKTNTDSSGSPTPRGYEQALIYLQPFINSGKESEALDAQRLIAGYNNSLDRLNTRKRNQEETISAFKLQEFDSYFTSFDGEIGGFRNPASLIGTTSESLDSLLLGVINAIDQKEVNGDSTDALRIYMNDLNKRANKMRDLRNKFENGELTGKTLDGFGYYIDSNPLDGNIRGAALLPVGLVPSDISKGYRRIEATATVNGALLPIYAPFQQDELGDYIARIGDATWSGTGQGVLQKEKAEQSKSLFQEGAFDISDSFIFPARRNVIEKGTFGRGFVGNDIEGRPVESILYRGVNGTLYSVDQETIDSFRKDPILNKKLDGYVTQFSPTEMAEFTREAVPFSEEKIGFESRIGKLQSEEDISRVQAEQLEKQGFFGKLKSGISMLAQRGRERKEERSPTFFESKNIPTKPKEPIVGLSIPDIVEGGKSFFRKVGEGLEQTFRR